MQKVAKKTDKQYTRLGNNVRDYLEFKLKFW